MNREEAEKKAKTLKNWDECSMKLLKEGIITALMADFTVCINSDGLYSLDMKMDPGFGDAFITNIDE